MNQKLYNETLQACLAGGMTDDAAHEYATDKATRNEAPKAQHTPSPWVYGPEPFRRNWIIGTPFTDSEGGFDIAQIAAVQIPDKICTPASHQEQEANARLIAQAPAMFEALREIAERGPVDGYNSASALRLRLVATQTIAREALAKVSPDLTAPKPAKQSYRFTFRNTSWTADFATDDEAFTYATEADDAGKVGIQKQIDGTWHGWDRESQSWKALAKAAPDNQPAKCIRCGLPLTGEDNIGGRCRNTEACRHRSYRCTP